MLQQKVREMFERTVRDHMARAESCSTQELLDNGEVPRLAGYVVHPGKVSDSIYGGHVKFKNKQTGEVVEAENPPLLGPDGRELRILVRTPRISTHDLNRGEIPLKDQVLAVNHHYIMQAFEGLIPCSELDVPGAQPNAVVTVQENLAQIPVEMVVRAYMAKSSTKTSLYHHYVNEGSRTFCGHDLPEGLLPNGRLSHLLDTPSTKLEEHDRSVAPESLFAAGLCTPREYAEMRSHAFVAYGVVANLLRETDMLPVDTKLEFGNRRSGDLAALWPRMLCSDEKWTLDSSRFWRRGNYLQQEKELRDGVRESLEPISLSKEFARCLSKGDQPYTQEEQFQVACNYLEGLFELTGGRLELMHFDPRTRVERVKDGLLYVVDKMVA